MRSRLVYARTKLSSEIEKQEQVRYVMRISMPPRDGSRADNSVTNGILDVGEHDEPTSAKETVEAVEINPFRPCPWS